MAERWGSAPAPYPRPNSSLPREMMNGKLGFLRRRAVVLGSGGAPGTARRPPRPSAASPLAFGFRV